MATAVPKVLVIYGSETGNSESISKRIHQEAIALQYESTWVNMSDFKKVGLDTAEGWPRNTPVIIVTSSTGSGDPPGPAEMFWRSLRKQKEASFLQDVYFTLLGLGDSNYDSYQGFPSALQTKMIELGAKEFYGRGKADEATGLEAVVEPWITDLWGDLAAFVEAQAAKPVELAPVAVSAGGAEPTAVPAATATPTPVAEAIVPAEKTVVAKKAAGARKVGTLVPKAPPAVSYLSTIEPSEVPQVTDVYSLKGARLNAADPVDRTNPYMAKMLWARQITTSDAAKTVIYMSLDVSNSDMNLEPGHAFGIICPNPAYIVNALIDRLSSSPANIESAPTQAPLEWDTPLKLNALEDKYRDQMPKHIAPRTSGVCTLREALTHYVDLTTLPSKRLLILLAQFTSDPAEKAKLTLMATGEGKEDYRVQIELRKASILDILDDFPSCRPPVSYLLDVLPQMQPRYYSLANSLSVFPNEVHFMFVVVDFHTTEPFHKRFRGICTNYLFEKAKNSGLLKREDATGEDFEKKMADMTISEQGGEHPYVAIFPRRSDESFVINADLSRPTIMIGPGTGVAPFIGFLQHRRYRRDHEAIKLGHATLYFGCRHPDKDFLFKNELEGFVTDESLSRLVTAFSRYEEQRVVYVQHRMMDPEHAAQIADVMLKQDGVLYLCGDAKGMARGVREALVEILKKHGNMTEQEANDTILSWNKSKRYMLDIWA